MAIRTNPGRRLGRTTGLFTTLIIAASLVLSSPVLGAERKAKLPKGYRQLDGIAAVVGRKIITLSQLVRAQAQNSASQKLVPTRQSVRPRNRREMLRQVLDTLIDNLLVTQAATSLGITVPDTEIDGHLKKLRDRNLWDMDELKEAVRKMGFADVAAYRQHVRAEKLRVKMIRSKLGSRLRVAEAEIKRVLDLQYKGGTVEEELHSRHILIKVPEGASPVVLNRLRDKAWKIHDVVQAKKKSFVDAAEEFSDDEGTEYGGDLGWMRRWMLDQTFAGTLWSLKKGQISKVVQTPFGFHIIKLIDRRTVKAKNKRILEQMVRAQLMEKQFAKLYEQWIAELRRTAHVEIRI
ncbi:MAG: peptidylprolyl isomerase [Myxococcales bacterium]|nr:peptidylprolyl isomerase [Myxococcales bacterium]